MVDFKLLLIEQSDRNYPLLFSESRPSHHHFVEVMPMFRYCKRIRRCHITLFNCPSAINYLAGLKCSLGTVIPNVPWVEGVGGRRMVWPNAQADISQCID